MTAPTRTWHAHNVIVGCRRCGTAVKVRYGEHLKNRNNFCSEQCEEWHDDELRAERLNRQAARVAMSKWRHAEVLSTTPLHEIYPGMLEVLDRVQRMRPSYWNPREAQEEGWRVSKWQ